VYGVTDLEIETERGEPEPVFRASYTKWVPDPAEEAQADLSEVQGPGFTSLEIRERIYLRFDRKDWVIYRFEPF
jgi:hypothetical protein